ncbi:hypothetical protein GCM10010405_49810 [Streptomyces macrosporus]|uniref:Uncharacterized protein n=1 Tax=Streptomyces macrosporus TaxID=44032 RepID=A0ABN3KKK0_9ACTN
MPTASAIAAIPAPRLGEAHAGCPLTARTVRPGDKRLGTCLSGPLPWSSRCPQTAAVSVAGPRTTDVAPAYGALSRPTPEETEVPRCPAF